MLEAAHDCRSLTMEQITLYLDYFINGVSLLLLAVLGFFGSLSYSGGSPFRVALIMLTMAEKNAQLVAGVANVTWLYRLSAGLVIAVLLFRGSSSIITAFQGFRSGGLHLFLLGLAACAAACAVGSAVVIGAKFRRAAIKLRDKYRGTKNEFDFWHWRPRNAVRP